MVEWSIFNEIFAVAFNVLYFVIIIGTIFIVILDNRNPVKTTCALFPAHCGACVLFLFRQKHT